jgi:hypothetical protein
VGQAAEAAGMSSVFVGIMVVAILGNAAEHSTAVLAAIKNRMDLSLDIAIGSSTQIALFVASLLVFLSYFIGPQPMELVFTRGEILWEHSLFFRSPNRLCMLGVRGEFLLTTLGMGGPDDGLRSSPFAGRVSRCATTHSGAATPA